MILLYRCFLLGQGELDDPLIIIDQIGQSKVEGIKEQPVNKILKFNFISGKQIENRLPQHHQFFFSVCHMVILRIRNLVLPEVRQQHLGRCFEVRQC